MKIEHLELALVILSAVLLGIVGYLLRALLSHWTRGARSAPADAGARRPGRSGRTSLRWPRLNPSPAAAEVSRLRQLRPVSEHANGAVTGSDSGHASLTCQVEGRLELAFEQFSRGRISIFTYRELVQIETDLIMEHIVQSSGAWPVRVGAALDDGDLDADIVDAMALTRWCLDWADEMMVKLGVSDAPDGSDAALDRRLHMA